MEDGELVTRRIIGAETVKRPCPACHGSGTVEGVRLLGKYCPAVMHTGHEELSCLVEGFHDGLHEFYAPPPCEVCWGMDEHVEDCTAIDDPTQHGYGDWLDLRFDDSGAYWVVPKEKTA